MAPDTVVLADVDVDEAALALDDGPPQIADVIVRMGVGKQYANVHRTRLIEVEMIHSAGRGRVDFALPFLREYLRDHAVTLGLADPTPLGEAGV